MSASMDPLRRQAYRLGQEIQYVMAAERAALKTRGRFRPTARQEYDPLEATCLAELIYSRMKGTTP